MSKINSPIRLKKVITGYKGLKKIKGNSDKYTVTTDTPRKNASIYDSSGALVGQVSGENVTDLIKNLREGLLSLGAHFPNVIVDNVPFLSFEVQNVAFAPAPNFGSFKLNHGSDATALLAYNASLATIKAALRALPGLENILATGTIPTSINVDFRGVPGNISNLTVSNNTLSLKATSTQTVTFSGVRASGSYILNYGGNPTIPINWNDNAAAIQTKLQAVPGLTSTTVVDTSSTVLTFTFNGNIAATALTVTSNSLMTVAPAAINAVVADTTPAPTSTVVTVTEVSPGE